MTPTAAEATTTTNKVAMITGGNRGLGLVTARLLGQAGVTIVIAARDEERLHEAVVALRSENIYASAIQADINVAASIAGAVD
ncbi:MAG: SDR family NAD(P)-dependent oxidoreductase [Nocardioides sp.]|jgi:NAD(P)-dependent dehydrogenase (short-subunit alcohol dehydrogenase family)